MASSVALALYWYTFFLSFFPFFHLIWAFGLPPISLLLSTARATVK